ncbi:MAG TPA: glycosyl hydrolase [Verrucomicrobiae bacterium]|nr:glycosyl hydrolase [Verrucomicrobiae bacterium]
MKQNSNVQRTRAVARCLVITIILLGAASRVSANDALSWPTITREQRPWAYWWWMGSAVDQTNLTRELTRYANAGYGGVHIIPIYGARGWETNYIDYLSPRWMEMLDYTVREAKRLDLGIDMTTGTGWCFGGGPHVGEAEGNANVVVKTLDLAAGARLAEKFDRKKTQALVAYPSSGKPVDLTKKIASDGNVDWVVPDGTWKIYAISQKLNGQKVKRASPGGEGPMLNLIYPEAMPVFLRSYTEAFARYQGLKPRAQYHDSYEYKSDWAPDFFQQFERRRGYKLQNELPALFGKQKDERSARVLADYRETVSDIMIEESLPQWIRWSHQRGFITRNEAHGSPGNLLDLYALADVPETEMFRLDRNKLISKFASSAAHVTGRKLTSSETGTWLKEHFTETLADMKYLVDDLFVSGVNHIFYHGTCYSPDEAGWPGWVFYASYQMNPRNSVWHDARVLNEYVARCQSVLQAGQPDNDVLVYWPIHDFWQKAPAEPLLPHLTIHARGWFEGQPVARTAEHLWKRGFSFDFISDRQLADAKATRNRIKVAGGTYAAIVVPPCEVIPSSTMEKLVALAKAGATVIFEARLPKDVPGLGDLDKRRAKLKGLGEQGLLVVGEVEPALAAAKIAREPMVDHKDVFFIRRSFEGGRYYFIANRSDVPIIGWVPLAMSAKSAVLMDPMTGRAGLGALRNASANQSEVCLELQPGESVVVRAFEKETIAGPPWTYWRGDGRQPMPVSGAWKLEFLSGGPTLPSALNTTNLASWTELGGDEAKRFAGTACFAIKFDAPPDAGGKSYALDLGKVCQSARVRLNGRDYGTDIVSPFRVVVDNLRATGNELEVEVTNVSANRIRDLDQRGVKWQNFRDINIVNQDYRPFNAATWPLTESGLIGPVTLTALNAFHPDSGAR